MNDAPVLVCAILKSFVGAIPLSHFLSDMRSIAFANSVIIYGASIATNLLLTILDTISAIVAIRPPHTKSRIIYIII